MEKHHPEDQLEEELAPEEKQKDATPSVPAYDSPQGTKGPQQTADRDHADGLNANSPAGGSQTDHRDIQPEDIDPEPGTYSGRQLDPSGGWQPPVAELVPGAAASD